MEKVKIYREDDSIYIDWFADYVSIEEMRSDLEELESKGITHIRITTYDSYNNNISILACKNEYETDEEFEIRKKNILINQKALENERKEYERLKEKFEK